MDASLILSIIIVRGRLKPYVVLRGFVDGLVTISYLAQTMFFRNVSTVFDGLMLKVSADMQRPM